MEISQDNTFLFEIRHHLRYAVSTAVNLFNSVDIISVILEDIVPLIIAHLERVFRLSSNLSLEVLFYSAKK